MKTLNISTLSFITSICISAFVRSPVTAMKQPLHVRLEQRLLQAAKDGKDKLVHDILTTKRCSSLNIDIKTTGAMNLGGPEYTGYTPLHWAANLGHFSIIQILVAHGATIDSEDTHSETPMLVAVKNNHYEIAEFLLTVNAQVDAQDNLGRTSLHYAIMQPGGGNLAMVELLLFYNAPLDLEDNTGETPFELAVHIGSRDVFRHIYETALARREGLSAKIRDLIASATEEPIS